jgi:hypothetical protein
MAYWVTVKPKGFCQTSSIERVRSGRKANISVAVNMPACAPLRAGQALSEPHLGAVVADQRDRGDLDGHLGRRAVARRRIALLPRGPHGAHAGLGRPGGLGQHAAHAQIVVELVVGLAVKDVAVDLRLDDGGPLGERDRFDRGIRQRQPVAGS